MPRDDQSPADISRGTTRGGALRESGLRRSATRSSPLARSALRSSALPGGGERGAAGTSSGSRARIPARRARTAGGGSDRSDTRRFDTRSARTAATQRLRRFRQQTSLAVAITGLALLLTGGAGEPAGASVLQGGAEQDTVIVSPLSVDSAAAATAGPAPPALGAPAARDSARIGDEAARSVEEATSTIRSLVHGSYRVLPKLVIAILLLALAALITRLARPALRRLLASFARADAISALVGIGIWLLALGAAMSVLAGDARALLGSVGLVGLALSWALQAPIESFAGWLLNSFRGYYAVGDRILVGDVFGDVYKIDFLTTMVWEAGGPGKAVAAAQSTGAVITFPNSEVLRSNITNYTRDFAYVWDEATVGVTNESDLPYAMKVIREVADQVMGDSMAEPAAEYERLLRNARLDGDVADHPQLYVSPTDSWVDITIRYLVPVRERRGRATELQVALAVELARPEHAGRIGGSYPVRRLVPGPDQPAALGATGATGATGSARSG